MRSKNTVRWVVLTAALFSSMVGRGVRTEERRDLEGFYQITNVADAGDQVSLTLTLDVINHSGAELPAVRVSLVDSAGSPASLHSFAPFDISDEGIQRLTGTFLVPVNEYQSWQGGAPRLAVEYVDPLGETRRPLIELQWLPIGQEGR